MDHQQTSSHLPPLGDFQRYQALRLATAQLRAAVEQRDTTVALIAEAHARHVRSSIVFDTLRCIEARVELLERYVALLKRP